MIVNESALKMVIIKSPACGNVVDGVTETRNSACNCKIKNLLKPEDKVQNCLMTDVKQKAYVADALSLHRDCRPVSTAFMFFIMLTLLISVVSSIPQNANYRGRKLFTNHHFGGKHHKSPEIYLNQYAVNLASSDDTKAKEIASKYGFIFKGQIGSLQGWYLFEDKRIFKRSLHSVQPHISSHRLTRDNFVNIVERLKILRRVKRHGTPISSMKGHAPNDPAWKKMWYMHCGGVNNSVCPTSMRISDAWRAGYFGADVVVTILDDGIETVHPDLRLNYDANASYDINDMDNNPTPRYDHSNENKHGTRCAGVVAAVSDNRICSVGIAYRAKIGGVRMLDGEVTDNVEARSLGFNPQHVDIYSASWGPDDDGSTVEGPGYLAKAAFKDGAKWGRGGKGSIFVWASGNGGHNKDTCSCDGYINSIYTIGISSVSQNGKRPWYLESCASTLATTYSSGEVDEGKVITTDLRGTCTYAHTGTSASAPMAAGVIALMLDANQNLTWRDVQHIIVRTSNPYGLQADDWLVNGAGYNVSHVFGFGLMDAARLTHVANKWKTVPEQRQCQTNPHRLSKTITPHRPLYLSVETRACSNKLEEINFLEHVILRISLTHSRRGDLQIFLTSPAGTRSNILERRSLDRSSAGFDEWDFMTTHHWGESPMGLWTLEIFDSPFRLRYRDHSQINELRKWQLIFYGSRENPQPNFYYNSCDAFPQDQCHPECKGCCGPTEMECRLCRHVATFTGTCISACPMGQFAHPHTKICQPCWKTCRECTTALESNCTECHSGFSLLDGQCVKTCTEGYFLEPITQQCRACHQLCNTCEFRNDKCTSCRPGFEKIGDTCNPSCPSGTFLLSYRDGCQLCHSSCLECTSSSSAHCTACAEGLVLHKRRCVASCPRRYFLDTRRPSCKLCHDSCKTCEGATSSDCTACVSDFTLQNGQCKEVCRDGYNGSYRSYPCLLVIQMRWCSFEVFHTLCCETCTQFESGKMFEPSKVEDFNLENYNYDDEDGVNYTDIDHGFNYGYDDDDDNDYDDIQRQTDEEKPNFHAKESTDKDGTGPETIEAANQAEDLIIPRQTEQKEVVGDHNDGLGLTSDTLQKPNTRHKKKHEQIPSGHKEGRNSNLES